MSWDDHEHDRREPRMRRALSGANGPDALPFRVHVVITHTPGTDFVDARTDWAEPVRGPAPRLTDEQIVLCAKAARALLNAEPGTLVATSLPTGAVRFSPDTLTTRRY